MILCEQPFKRKLVFGHMVRLRLRFFLSYGIQCRFSHGVIATANLNPTQLISCEE